MDFPGAFGQIRCGDRLVYPLVRWRGGLKSIEIYDCIYDDAGDNIYDEYCDFMKKYNENPSDLKLLAEYADMLSEAADMDEAFEEWDEEEMNDAELKNYLDVNNRVMQKLVDMM